MKQISILLFFIMTIISCTKEYSFENPLSGTTSITIGNNCIINSITAVDTFSNRGSSAFNYTFNTAGTFPLTVLLQDSITASAIFSKSLVKMNDTLRVDANQYFVIDTTNSNRIKQFVGQENPYFSGSTIFKYVFNYDNSGKLLSKVQQNASFGTLTVAQTDYTYSGNNLTTITSKIPLTNTVYFTAALEYDVTKQPKNYVHFLAEATELQPYIAALHLGAKSLNAPTKIVRKNYAPLTGTFIDSTVTNYANYKYSTDGYVVSVDATGYTIPALPLLAGRNRFGYYCR